MSHHQNFQTNSFRSFKSFHYWYFCLYWNAKKFSKLNWSSRMSINNLAVRLPESIQQSLAFRWDLNLQRLSWLNTALRLIQQLCRLHWLCFISLFSAADNLFNGGKNQYTKTISFRIFDMNHLWFKEQLKSWAAHCTFQKVKTVALIMFNRVTTLSLQSCVKKFQTDTLGLSLQICCFVCLFGTVLKFSSKEQLYFCLICT